MKFNDHPHNVKDIGFHKFNEKGLSKAYSSPKYIFTNDDELFIAGTQTGKDVFDDISKIPFGQTKYSTRYLDSEKMLLQNPQIKRVVGHSLGGSVALELQKNHPEKHLTTTTYGAPVASFSGASGDDSRWRAYGDPISALDFGANNVLKSNLFNSYHSYKGF